MAPGSERDRTERVIGAPHGLRDAVHACLPTRKPRVAQHEPGWPVALRRQAHALGLVDGERDVCDTELGDARRWRQAPAQHDLVAKIHLGVTDQAKRILIVRTACARDEEGAGQRTGVGDDPRIAAVVVGHDVRRQCRGAPRDDDAADREEIEDRAGRIYRDVDRAAGQEPALAPGTGEVLDAMRRQPVVARDLAEPVQHAQVLAGPEHHALVRIGSRSQVRDRRRLGIEERRRDGRILRRGRRGQDGDLGREEQPRGPRARRRQRRQRGHGEKDEEEDVLGGRRVDETATDEDRIVLDDEHTGERGERHDAPAHRPLHSTPHLGRGRGEGLEAERGEHREREGEEDNHPERDDERERRQRAQPSGHTWRVVAEHGGHERETEEKPRARPAPRADDRRGQRHPGHDADGGGDLVRIEVPPVVTAGGAPEVPGHQQRQRRARWRRHHRHPLGAVRIYGALTEVLEEWKDLHRRQRATDHRARRPGAEK